MNQAAASAIKKDKPAKLSAMARAGIAMYLAGSYYCGGDDRWCFAGRYDQGCHELEQSGFADNRGLRVFKAVSRTLTSEGESVLRPMYRLNNGGKSYVETLLRSLGRDKEIR